MKITSSGGTGDNLIVLSKLHKLHNETGEKFIWNHYARHSFYEKSCNDIIHCRDFILPESRFICEKYAKDVAQQNGTYLTTECNNEMLPFIPPIKSKNPFIILTIKKYICVHMSAGRPSDGTNRIIDKSAIKQIKDFFPQYDIILIGANSDNLNKEYKGRYIHLESGTTNELESILDAFNIINGCSAFVGQDGVLAYYAMMQKKPTIINFHLQGLKNHYMNKEWWKKTIVLYCSHWVKYIPNSALENFKNLLIIK